MSAGQIGAGARLSGVDRRLVERIDAQYAGGQDGLDHEMHDEPAEHALVERIEPENPHRAAVLGQHVGGGALLGVDQVADRLALEIAEPRVVGEAPFDISEMSFSSYLVQVARGEGVYAAIPVFISRAFRHDGIYVREGAGINGPKDLEGRLVGVPEYQMTMALWVRGILGDEYDVDFRKIRYRTGGANKPGRKERLPLELPEDMDVAPIPKGSTLNELLLAGELDAVIAPTPPDGYRLLIVMPGGNGGPDFHPFIKRIYKNVLSDEYLLAQIVAPEWSPDQGNRLVWPTETNRWPAMRFPTEQLVDDVIADIEQTHKLDPRFLFTLAWSSSGPAAYAISLRPATRGRR